MTKTEITADLPERDRLTVPGFGHLSIVGDGSHWAGSLIYLIRTLLSELLDDAPIEATVWIGGDHRTVTRYVGTVTAVDDYKVMFADGVTVDVDDVLSLTI